MAEVTTEITTPTDREIVITSVFNAPRDKVWRAYTEAGYIPEWWGPGFLTTVVDKLDFRKGGEWRFVQRDPDGKEYAFNGKYREIIPGKKIVQTWEWEEMPGYVHLETADFEDLDGGTKVVARALFFTKEERDGLLQSDMESGVREGNERLARLLEAM